MAGYGADYPNDFGKVYRSVRLVSKLVRTGGVTSPTKSDFDLPYLPAIYLNAVEPNARRVCSLAFTPRAVRLFLSEDEYLYLQHPFQPATADFNNFLAQAKSNPLIFGVERIGEKLNDQYTDLLTR